MKDFVDIKMRGTTMKKLLCLTDLSTYRCDIYAASKGKMAVNKQTKRANKEAAVPLFKFLYTDI
jgi:hypothetical protein